MRMNEEVIQNRINFILYGANTWRVTFRYAYGIWQIRVDVHEMSAVEAKKLLHDLITLLPGAMQMCVVHGYHGGTAIKDTLRKEEISHRIYHMESPEYNPGITWMDITDRIGQTIMAA